MDYCHLSYLRIFSNTFRREFSWNFLCFDLSSSEICSRELVISLIITLVRLKVYRLYDAKLLPDSVLAHFTEVFLPHQTPMGETQISFWVPSPEIHKSSQVKIFYSGKYTVISYSIEKTETHLGVFVPLWDEFTVDMWLPLHWPA